MQSDWNDAWSGFSSLYGSSMRFKKNTCSSCFYLDCMRFSVTHAFWKNRYSFTVCNEFCERVDKGRIRFLSLFIRTDIILSTLNGLHIDPFHNPR